MPSTSSNVKNEKLYEALEDEGMRKERSSEDASVSGDA